VGGPRSGPKPNAERRRRVIRLRAQGRSLGEIARRLGITTEGARFILLASGQDTKRPAAVLRCRDCGVRIAEGNWWHEAKRPLRCPACLPADAPLGVRLRSCRLAAGLTRAGLAARAGVGVTSVHHYELGRWQPAWAGLARLLRVLGPGLLPSVPPSPGTPPRDRCGNARRRRSRAVELSARGLGPAAIAARLGVSAKSVKRLLREHRRGLHPPAPPRCRACARAVGERTIPHPSNGPMLCLTCLARQQQASFGERLHAFRLAAGLTQRELAQRAGLHNQALCDLEAGRKMPQWLSAARLLRVLGPPNDTATTRSLSAAIRTPSAYPAAPAATHLPAPAFPAGHSAKKPPRFLQSLAFGRNNR
jgi:transcriptional regulator with XRE-family HTH domain/DNA-binding CsgD family transcriptional regulator